MPLLKKDDPLDLAKAEHAKLQRDILHTTNSLAAAQALAKSLTEGGASDTEIDTAEKQVVTFQRKLVRLKIAAQRTADTVKHLSSTATQARRAALNAAVVQTGLALAKARQPAQSLFYEHIAARGELERAGFASDVHAYPTPPVMIVSLANANSASFGQRPAPNLALDHFAWFMNQQEANK